MRLEIYKCLRCKKKFQRDLNNQMNCCVIHVDECCHAFEQEVTKKGWPKQSGKNFVGSFNGEWNNS